MAPRQGPASEETRMGPLKGSLNLRSGPSESTSNWPSQERRPSPDHIRIGPPRGSKKHIRPKIVEESQGSSSEDLGSQVREVGKHNV